MSQSQAARSLELEEKLREVKTQLEATLLEVRPTAVARLDQQPKSAGRQKSSLRSPSNGCFYQVHTRTETLIKEVKGESETVIKEVRKECDVKIEVLDSQKILNFWHVSDVASTIAKRS